MKISFDPLSLPAQVLVHVLISVSTLIVVQVAASSDFAWTQQLVRVLLWFAVFGSFALCVPVYVMYFSKFLLNHKVAWIAIFVQLSLNIFTLSLVHRWFGISYGCVVDEVEKTCLTTDFGEGIYFSIVTFTTLGYGDFHPTDYGRYFAAMQAMAGYLVLGLTVGAILYWAETRKN